MKTRAGGVSTENPTVDIVNSIQIPSLVDLDGDGNRLYIGDLGKPVYWMAGRQSPNTWKL